MEQRKEKRTWIGKTALPAGNRATSAVLKERVHSPLSSLRPVWIHFHHKAYNYLPWNMCIETCSLKLSWNINKTGITVHMSNGTALKKTKAVPTANRDVFSQQSDSILQMSSACLRNYSIWIFWAVLFIWDEVKPRGKTERELDRFTETGSQQKHAE